jgi:hypothetical protein
VCPEQRKGENTKGKVRGQGRGKSQREEKDSVWNEDKVWNDRRKRKDRRRKFKGGGGEREICSKDEK